MLTQQRTRPAPERLISIDLKGCHITVPAAPSLGPGDAMGGGEVRGKGVSGVNDDQDGPKVKVRQQRK